MTAYAVGRLTDIHMGPDIVAYLQAIDGTLAPFGGAFAIHGGPKEVLEGTWPDDLVAIAFPDLASARAWYDSPGYQAIIGLRTRNARSHVILIAGVDADHRATDIQEAVG